MDQLNRPENKEIYTGFKDKYGKKDKSIEIGLGALKADNTFSYDALMIAQYAAQELMQTPDVSPLMCVNSVSNKIMTAALQEILYQKAHASIKNGMACFIDQRGGVAAHASHKLKNDNFDLYATQLGALYFNKNNISHTTIVYSMPLENLQKDFNAIEWTPHHLIKDSKGKCQVERWLKNNFPRPYTTLALNKEVTHAAAAKGAWIDIFDLTNLERAREDINAVPLRTIDLHRLYDQIPLFVFSPSTQKCALVAQGKSPKDIPDLIVAPFTNNDCTFTIIENVLLEKRPGFEDVLYQDLEWTSENEISITKKNNAVIVNKKLTLIEPAFHLGNDEKADEKDFDEIKKTLPMLLQRMPVIEEIGALPHDNEKTGMTTHFEEYITDNYSLSTIALPVNGVRRPLSPLIQEIVRKFIRPTLNFEKEIKQQTHGLLYAYVATLLFGDPKTETYRHYKKAVSDAYKKTLGTLTTGATIHLSPFGKLYYTLNDTKIRKMAEIPIARTNSLETISTDTLCTLAVASDAEKEKIFQKFERTLKSQHGHAQRTVLLDGSTVTYVGTDKKLHFMSVGSKNSTEEPPTSISLKPLYKGTKSCDIERIDKLIHRKIAMGVQRLNDQTGIRPRPYVCLVDTQTKIKTLYPVLMETEGGLCDLQSNANFNIPIRLNMPKNLSPEDPDNLELYNPEVCMQAKGLLECLFPRVRILYAQSTDQEPTEYRLQPFTRPLQWSSFIFNRCYHTLFS
jgi:hypothetical protein